MTNNLNHTLAEYRVGHSEAKRARNNYQPTNHELLRFRILTWILSKQPGNALRTLPSL